MSATLYTIVMQRAGESHCYSAALEVPSITSVSRYRLMEAWFQNWRVVSITPVSTTKTERSAT